MNYRVVYSRRSQKDVDTIRAYITSESGKKFVADRFTAELLAACDGLATLPDRFGLYRLAPRWHMMPIEKYLVFFKIKDDEGRIGHIRHGARKPFRG